MERYDPATIEPKWQAVWEREGAFETPNPNGNGHGEREHAQSSYVLEMLPYPSGELHMGHVKNYTMGDVLCHFRRRNGMMVLHPMGYDAFGLPAENAAIREGGHPREVTERNIAAIRRQMQRMGWSIDWKRELSTADPRYYRWTQWIFLRLFERGLAYKKESPVKWCPVDQTVLANEQVIDSHCERCGSEVITKNLEQWYFKITDYAQRLLDDMALLEDWPERVLTMQRNWIGRSEGAEVLFRQPDLEDTISVFTTRPDTLYGATFFVLAPEHPMIPTLVAGTTARPRCWTTSAAPAPCPRRSGPQNKQKTGVDTGSQRDQPGDRRAPSRSGSCTTSVWPTGPAPTMRLSRCNDQRDFEFASQHGLPITHVVAPRSGEVEEGQAFVSHSDDEVLVNSGAFSGQSSREGAAAIVAMLQERGGGTATTAYRLRDWLISRQRYWGCPIPIVELPDLRAGAGARRPAAGAAAGHRGLPAEGALAAGRRRGLGAHHVPRLRRRGASRDRHDGHLHRFIVVLPGVATSQGTGRLPFATRRNSTPGCRSLSTRAASSTRSCTCCTPAFSQRCCTTRTWSPPRSRSPASSHRAWCCALAAGRCRRPRATWSRRARHRALRRRHRPPVHAVHGPARERRRVERLRRVGGLEFLNRPFRLFHASPRGPGRARCGGRAGRGARQGRPAAPQDARAIAKASDHIQLRLHFNTAIAACMELSNTINEAREAAGDDEAAGPGLRYAATTLTSLLRRSRRTSPRSCGWRWAARSCGASPGRLPISASCRPTPSRWWCRSTASCEDAWTCPSGWTRPSCWRARRPSTASARTSRTADSWSRRSWFRASS